MYLWVTNKRNGDAKSPFHTSAVLSSRFVSNSSIKEADAFERLFHSLENLMNHTYIHEYLHFLGGVITYKII